MLDRRGKFVLGWVLGLSLGLLPGRVAAAQPGVDAGASGETDGAGEDRAGRVVEHAGVLEEGEFLDLYEVEVEQGDHLIVNVRTFIFDAYLSVVSPSGAVTGNNDWNLSRHHSHVHLIADASGVWRVRVAGFDIHQFGEYRVDWFTGPESPDGSRPPMSERGELASGDAEVPGAPGRYMDQYPLEGVAGEHLTIDLTSQVFDTVLILEHDATGQRWENDDFQARQDLSHLGVTLPEAGAYTLTVTSFSPKQVGEYDLLVQRGAPPPTPADTQQDEHAGELAAEDAQRDDGAYIDTYPFDGQAGEEVEIDLRSQAFDTFLVLRLEGEDGAVVQRWENDDVAPGNTAHSHLSLSLPADGPYVIEAGSYDRGETGAYTLDVSRVAPREGELIEGALADGDALHRRGELIDWIDVTTEPGQVIEVVLASEDFDTYLIVQTPTGATMENDDDQGSASRSRVVMNVQRPGVHRVGVTTFEPGMSGAYTVDIRLSAAPDPRSQRDIVHLEDGDGVDGSLAYGDVVSARGSLADRYSFDVQAGQRVVVDMTSPAFDTFLAVILPNGEVLDNDDFDGPGHSRLSFEAAQTGPHRLIASSFMGDHIGDYHLALQLNDRASAQPPAVPGRRIHGLFIGISDYGGFADLPFCVEDATRVHNAMRDAFGMRAEDAVLLTDQKATIEAVEEALAEIASRASADDMVVVFYSGHGGQVAIENFTAQDPDAKDETLVLVDGEMTDDTFAELLGDVEAGTQLIVIDSCFAGGFAKDVVSVPGRMGLFSSEEDVLSLVAARFQAGGYLAMFVAEAVGERRDDADLNSDRMLTALELCHYVSARYQETLTQPKPIDQYIEEEVVNPLTNMGFQKLVTDRGGVSPNHVLLRW